MNEKCFALRKTRNGTPRCACLVDRCTGHTQCPFYKPVWKYSHDMELKYARLAALPEAKQLRIAYKYYDGLMPWRGESE